MTTINELNERIIELQDKQIAALEDARQKEKKLHAEEMKRTNELYGSAVAHVAAERDEAIALADELKKDAQHWQAQFDREHNAFVQVANDRDQALRDKGNLRRRNAELRNDNADLKSSNNALHANLNAAKANEKTAVDNLAQALCECDELRSRLENLQKCNEVQQEFIESICNLCAEEASLEEITELCISYRRGQTYGKWMVYVVEHQGNEKVFTGWFKEYDLARESVDLMVARGCYEAWIEELIQ